MEKVYDETGSKPLILVNYMDDIFFALTECYYLCCYWLMKNLRGCVSYLWTSCHGTTFLDDEGCPGRDSRGLLAMILG